MNIKELAEYLNITEKQAKDIKGIIKGTLDPLGFESVSTWVNQCYNMPSKLELKLCAINEVLEGFGVEYIEHINDTFTEVYGLDYINLGDTYIPTVIYNHSRNCWHYRSWGDIVESSLNVYV